MTPAELTFDEQATLTAGVDLWHTAGVDRIGLAGIGVTDGPSGARGAEFMGSASTSLPCGTRAGRDVEPRADRAGRPPARRRGPRQRGERAARADREPAPPPARRTELRVLLRRPVPDRRDRGGLHRRGAEPRRGLCGQALRLQRPGDRPHGDRRRRRRTDPSRALPPALRGRRPARRRVGRHGGLQPRRRPVLQRAPRAPDRRAALRVGFRRRGDVRLVRHPQRSRTRRRARPGDARPTDGPRPPPRRSR